METKTEIEKMIMLFIAHLYRPIVASVMIFIATVFSIIFQFFFQHDAQQFKTETALALCS